jgi:hypothetical protein
LGVFFAVLIVVTMMTVQSPVRDQPPAPTPGTGVIRGRVVRADTGEPLRRVVVRIDEWSAKDQRGPISTMTDAQGRYELTELPAGSYHIKATRGGFVELAYGQRRPFERGRPVEVADGAVVQNIDFALPSGGVVTGRVSDELGDTVTQVYVALARRRYVDGERRLVTVQGSSTDDRGEFRIFGVPPGEYVAIASFERLSIASKDRERYVPTYYPGTPVATEAQRITVAAGQEVPAIMITLARATTATVRGVVRSSGQASAGPFTFVTAREIGGPQAYGEVEMTTAARDGSFMITGLLPGTYMLEARGTPESESASSEVVIGTADVGGVTLVLSHGVSARGRITFDTGKPPQGLRPSQVIVVPSSLDHQMQGTTMSGGLPTARDDWTFELRGLRGRGFVRAGALTEDWQMKRVRRRDVDVTDTPLDFSTDIDDLEIELTQQATTVSGGVSDEHGGAVVDATVVVFADDPEKWGPQSRFVKSARPDQQGRFTLHDLPPGKYIAIALGYLEPDEERDPDLLQEWRPRGTAFTLTEGETHTLDLKLASVSESQTAPRTSRDRHHP